MPPDFRFLDMTPQPDMIVAVRLDPAQQAIGSFNFQVLARLKPGVTPAEAQADLERMLPIWLDAWPLVPGSARRAKRSRTGESTPVVRPLKDDMVGGVASMLWVLMGAIGAVLLVACANIANLMLVRADARRQELAVRAALGAVPARIARELLVESLVLGAAGGVLGLVLAYGGLELLVAIGPSNLPRLQEIAVYPPVLAFTVAVSLASTLVFGSITALKHALHVDTPVTGGARGSSASRERSATRSALVVVQVALALVLVVSAALMIRTFQALRDVDPGFSDPATIQTARIWIPTTLSPRRRSNVTRMQHEMLDKIAALPGVASAGFASALPMEGRRSTTVRRWWSKARRSRARRHAAAAQMEVRLAGLLRSHGHADHCGTRHDWARHRNGRPRGVDFRGFRSRARGRARRPRSASAFGRPSTTDAWREVIGVVQSVHEDGLYAEAPSPVYWPALMENAFGAPVLGTPSVAFVVRSERAGTASLVERDPASGLVGEREHARSRYERTMQDLYADSLARTSFTLVMLAIAGAMALALGVIGIYGVIAYVVSQRTREIGIRLALGAEPRQLERMFLRHGLALSAVGVVVGLVGARWRWRALMSSLLFGVEPTGPRRPTSRRSA